MSDLLHRGRPRAVLLLAAVLSAAPGLPAAVVLNEVHYDPPDGQLLEFVEIHNTGDSPVDLTGWGLTNGVRFTFGAGASIAARGFLLVARHPDALIEGSGLPPESVLGPFEGSLDDDGERIDLSDSQGAIVDWVRYEGEEPWDARARGQGPSLQRVCPTASARHWTGWTAAEPTPLSAIPSRACPPPAPPRPAIAINEIHYHGANLNDEHEEFIELRNNASAAVNLRGYRFTSGIEYRFEEDAIVEPGAAIVVCRDAEPIKRTFGLARAYGNFTGQLSNDGERITLVNSAGAIVDSVRYDDGGEWPVVADSLGASLEKIVPDATSDDPTSWTASAAPSTRNRQHVVVRGQATSSILSLQLDRTGECMIDNLSLIDLEDPTQNLISNGGFDRGVGFTRFEGSHAASGWDPFGGPDGSGALRLKGQYNPAFGGGEKILQNLVNRASLDLGSQVRINGPTYELSFDFRYVSGWRGLTVSFLESAVDRGIYWRFDAKPSATPGLPNTALAEVLPPRISDVIRAIREPQSTDAVTVRARVHAATRIRSVALEYWVNLASEMRTAPCFDDGTHGDLEAGDGIYGASLPAHPHNTIVTFRARAEDEGGRTATWPPETDPTGVTGYYVNDLRPASLLPIQHVLLDHTSSLLPRAVIGRLDCQHYWTGSFAFRGDIYPRIAIRMRGISVCMTPKPYLKLRFERGRAFEKQHKLNLQAMWTDKSLVRERLSWEVFNDLGYPSCRDEYVRVHANGKYYGLFAALENPDERMIERHGLNAEGNLYKSFGSNEGPGGDPTAGFEKETNENGDFSDLKTFLEGLHASPITRLRTFFAENCDEERIISYHLGQILIGNLDYAGHNHFLYHDPGARRWYFLPWDLDLTFGKAGVFDDYEFLPGSTPWFATSIDGEFQSYLLDRFFSDAGSWYRRAYLIRLFDTLHERFTEEFYQGRLAALRDLLFQEQKEDIQMWGRLTDQVGGQFPREFLPNLERVRHYVRERRQHLLRYLEQRSRFLGHDRMMITEINYNPANEDLEFVELWNPGSQPVDLSRWSIEGIGFVFPDGARADPDEIIVVSANPSAFEGHYGRVAKVFGPFDDSLDNAGDTLRLRDRGPGYLATIDQVRYEDDGAWPREADGMGRTLELRAVSTWRDNSLPGNWRASTALGGSPGTVERAERTFRRGDANSDAKIDLADALAILGHLYLGTGEPECKAAGDMNGDGRVEIDDPILLLRRLFLGDQTPIPFPGPGECGPTTVEVCRDSNCS